MIKDFETYIAEGRMGKLIDAARDGDIRKEDDITNETVLELVLKNKMVDRSNEIKKISFRKENEQTVVDIEGNFYLREDIKEIPIKFGIITGSFDCSCCDLTTLRGCPDKVTETFDCSCCDDLMSLDGCPQDVNTFICNDCGGEFCEKDVLDCCKHTEKIIAEYDDDGDYYDERDYIEEEE